MSQSQTPFVVHTQQITQPAEPVDQLVSTHHTISTVDGELSYTATTGRMVIRSDQDDHKVYEGSKAMALIGITSYILDDADVTKRPVVFCFNGGPGSPSIWLHMGLAGPRIVNLGSVDDLVGPPYEIRDNAHTLLRVADVVVIDAMSTGYSRAAEGNKAVTWHGWKKDAEQFSELIRLWCTRHDRWMSPKYILGESYGTTRAVTIAQILQDQYGMYFNGIILVSAVLDFGLQDFDILNWDESSINYLPTYAALAHYHGKSGVSNLREVIAEAERFADTDYRLALAKGKRLSPDDVEQIAARLAQLTGLSIDYVKRADLRIEHERFCQELLRDQSKVIGRIDGRFASWTTNPNAEVMDTDPSCDLTAGPFVAALHHYMHSELNCPQEMDYRISAQLWKSWNYHEFEGKPVNVTDKLERVLQANPHCRIRMEYGYYDLATPYYAARSTMEHLKIPDEVFAQFEFAHFDTGHMPYLDDESRVVELDGQCEFIRRTCSRAE